MKTGYCAYGRHISVTLQMFTPYKSLRPLHCYYRLYGSRKREFVVIYSGTLFMSNFVSNCPAMFEVKHPRQEVPVFILFLDVVQKTSESIPVECSLERDQRHDACYSICVRTLHLTRLYSGGASLTNGARFRIRHCQTLNPSYRLVVQNIAQGRSSAVTVLRARCLIEWRRICY